MRSTLSVISGTFFPGLGPRGLPTPVAVAADPVHGLLYVVESRGVLAAMNGSTGRVVHETFLNGTLGGLAVDPATNRIFVADQAQNLVSVVNGSSGKLLARVPAGVHPLGVAFDPLNGMVYVANVGSHNLSAIAAATNLPAGSLPAGNGSSWVTVDTRNGHLFVSDSGACGSKALKCNVTVVDPSTAKVLATVSVGNAPTRLLFDNRTNQIYVTVSNAARVAVLSGTTNAQVTSVGIGFSILGNVAVDLALDPLNDRVYAATHFNLVEINGTSHNVTNVSAGNLVASSVAFLPSTNKVFLANVVAPGPQIFTFSPVSHSFGSAFFLAGQPRQMLDNSFNGRVYVIDATLGRLDILNPTQGRILAHLPGVGPGGMTFNPLNGTVFLSQGNSIFVYNGTTNHRVAVLSDPHGARALAYDWSTGELYAADADGNISVFNAGANATVATIPVSGGWGAVAQDVLYDPNSNRVYADPSTQTNQYGAAQANISVINPLTHKVIHTLQYPFLAGAMAIDPGYGHRLYVVGNDPSGAVAGTLRVFTTVPFAFLTSISVSKGSSPNLVGVAYAGSNHDIYATSDANTLYKIYASNNTLAGSILVGATPLFPMYDPITYTVWVPNGGGGSISVVVP